jgi:hypothetical protein
MTKLLEQAIDAARRLSIEEQDSIAAAIMQLVGGEDAPLVPLSPSERKAIEASKAAAARGEFATEQEVRAVWAKQRR